jgi:hypothetical protein
VHPAGLFFAWLNRWGTLWLSAKNRIRAAYSHPEDDEYFVIKEEVL